MCLLDQPRDNTHGLSQLHAPATANHSGDLQGFRYEAVRCHLGLQASSTDVRLVAAGHASNPLPKRVTEPLQSLLASKVVQVLFVRLFTTAWRARLMMSLKWT